MPEAPSLVVGGMRSGKGRRLPWLVVVLAPVLGLLASCSSHCGWHAGSHSRSAPPHSAESAPLVWAQHGHLNTAHVVAQIAGLNHRREVDGIDHAHRLAHFSQAPDAIWWFYAAPVVAVTGSIPPIWPLTPYRHRIMNTLHSLHGGGPAEVAERRSRLQQIIASYDATDPSTHWKLGFLIHAYGDSFAHVRPCGAVACAYGELVGHGFDKEVKPDMIHLHLDNYLGYVRGLHAALDSGHGDSVELERFVKVVTDSVAKAKADPALTAEEREQRVAYAILGFEVEGSYPVDPEAPLAEWTREIRGAICFLGEVDRQLRR